MKVRKRKEDWDKETNAEYKYSRLMLFLSHFV